MRRLSIRAFLAGVVVTGTVWLAPAAFGEPGPQTRPAARESTARLERGAYLGVSASPATPVVRKQFGLSAGMGLIVDVVAPQSPAEEAGLKPLDVLQKLNDQMLVNPQQLACLVRALKPGDSLTLTVFREGKSQTLTAKLIEKELRPLDEMRFGSMPEMHEMDHLLARPPMAPIDVLGFRNLPGAALLHDNAIVGVEDGEHSFILTNKDGSRRLMARDRGGKTLFDGPIDTEAQRRDIPPEIHEKLSRLRLLDLPPSTRPSSDAATQPDAPAR